MTERTRGGKAPGEEIQRGKKEKGEWEGKVKLRGNESQAEEKKNINEKIYRVVRDCKYCTRCL